MKTPFSRNVERQAVRMGEMIERLDVDAFALAYLREGDSYEQARMTCFNCSNTLQDTSISAPTERHGENHHRRANHRRRGGNDDSRRGPAIVGCLSLPLAAIATTAFAARAPAIRRSARSSGIKGVSVGAVTIHATLPRAAAQSSAARMPNAGPSLPSPRQVRRTYRTSAGRHWPLWQRSPFGAASVRARAEAFGRPEG